MQDILHAEITIATISMSLLLIYMDVKYQERNNNLYRYLKSILLTWDEEEKWMILGDINGHVVFNILTTHYQAKRISQPTNSHRQS